MHLLSRPTIILALALYLAACSSSNDEVQTPDYIQDIAIDIEASMINGSFTLNTTDFPASVFQHGTISLRDANNGALTLLGESWEGGYDDLAMINGTYDSAYNFVQGNLVPRNADVSASVGHIVDMDKTIDIDVPRVIVVPNFTIDGNAFPTSVYQSAEFFLRPVGSEQLISLGTTNNQPSENVMVTPGTYDVIYSIWQGEQLPQNQRAILMRLVDITTTPHALNIDIETNQFNGSWRLSTDGVLANFPGSVYHHGIFSLQTEQGDFVYLGPSHASAGTIPVIASTYDVVYSHKDGDQVPQNQGKVVNSGLVLPPGETTLEDVVDAWTAVPTVTLDGDPFPGSVYESAEMFLKDEDTDALTSLGHTHNPLPSLLLVEGSYNTVYNHYSGEIVPRNNTALLNLNVVVDEIDEAIDIDVNSATVEGAFSLDGGKFYQSSYEAAEFFLYKDGVGNGILLGHSSQASEPVVILAGDYDVTYEFIDGSKIPRNSHHVLLYDQVYGGSDVIDINVVTRAVRPAFTLNGQPFPGSAYEQGELFLLGNHADDYVDLGSSAADPESRIVIQDTYEVLYRHVAGSIVPQNTEAVVGQVDVN